ncbi:MAG: carbohydrate ABC transporter permease [Bacillota bacterium]|nr:carbohydrate ABC transporter permease [Bacillota bacterium]
MGSTKSRKIVKQTLLYIVLSLITIYTLSPLVLLVINSFKPQNEIVSNPIALPKVFDLSYITKAMEQINFGSSILITLAITSASIILIVVASSLAAWMMVRNKTKPSKILFFAFTSAMLIPFQAVMYPLLSLFENMGLKNAVGLIIMYGGFGMSMSVFLFHGFLKSVPQEIEEAGVIDGAGPLRLFFTIVFPLLKGTTVTVMILNTMWIWNDYLLPFLVIGNSQGIKTLTLELYFAKLTSGQYGNPWELIFPAVFVTIIPIIILFIFLQKYIVKGITAGAIKG